MTPYPLPDMQKRLDDAMAVIGRDGSYYAMMKKARIHTHDAYRQDLRRLTSLYNSAPDPTRREIYWLCKEIVILDYEAFWALCDARQTEAIEGYKTDLCAHLESQAAQNATRARQHRDRLSRLYASQSKENTADPRSTSQDKATDEAASNSPATDPLAAYPPLIREAMRFLGLIRPCSFDAIRAEYKKMARRFHPDINPDPAASDMMKRVNGMFDQIRAYFHGPNDRHR